MKKMYVGNLPYSVSESDLNTWFSEYGEVASTAVIKDRDSGQSKGFGFVEMTSADDAQKAIAGLNGSEVEGRSLKVSEAKDRPERSNNRY